MLNQLAITALVLVVLCIPTAASAFDRFVNPDATCSPAVVGGLPEHDTIQEAVDAAANGDEIGVCAGTYPENVTVDKLDLSLLTIGHVIVAPLAGGTCFHVISDGVRIRGFEITLCSIGIQLEAGLGVIENNILHHNDVGVTVEGADNQLRNNLVRNSTDTGIGVIGLSSGTVVRNNTVRANALVGISVEADGGPAPVTIHKNLVQGSDVGIGVSNSTLGEVSFNSVTFHGMGIVLTDVDGYLIKRNNVSRSTPGPDCVWDGLGLNVFMDNNCRTEVPPGAWD